MSETTRRPRRRSKLVPRAALFAFAVVGQLAWTGAAMAETCNEQFGPEQAQEVVDFCIQVSAATHPPCNADNDCEIVIAEITRGCLALGPDAPAGCPVYTGNN